MRYGFNKETADNLTNCKKCEAASHCPVAEKGKRLSSIWHMQGRDLCPRYRAAMYDN